MSFEMTMAFLFAAVFFFAVVGWAVVIITDWLDRHK